MKVSETHPLAAKIGGGLVLGGAFALGGATVGRMAKAYMPRMSNVVPVGAAAALGAVGALRGYRSGDDVLEVPGVGDAQYRSLGLSVLDGAPTGAALLGGGLALVTGARTALGSRMMGHTLGTVAKNAVPMAAEWGATGAVGGALAGGALGAGLDDPDAVGRAAWNAGTQSLDGTLHSTSLQVVSGGLGALTAAALVRRAPVRGIVAGGVVGAGTLATGAGISATLGVAKGAASATLGAPRRWEG
jgi:hypothetical protein